MGVVSYETQDVEVAVGGKSYGIEWLRRAGKPTEGRFSRLGRRLHKLSPSTATRVTRPIGRVSFVEIGEGGR
jgi:hypothetical protein